METIFNFGTLLLLAAIGYIDARRKIIPNMLLLPMIITAFSYNLVASGPASIAPTLLNGAICFAVGCILYIIGVLSGGDVKLLAVLGVWLGFQETYSVFVIASLLGCAWAFIGFARDGILKDRFKVFTTGLYLKLAGTKGNVGFEVVPRDLNATAPAAALPLGTFIALTIITKGVYIHLLP